ncbi:RagB/SusD family nutrient uptake outer membrane protein [Parapedobacter koreensis]|uniref:Starch-binding associating with outer membrane n=1 Tax=Parapedobacter koreensis TaxID=332977 RepID=A0A1H7NTS3_9SPHI|nr:RagB/SusD family nutrient uptake outer membrane protein [Parapedobacter koreensis]SEL26425.1 Starch-binding associating with outer membrane [Parapedobacter koreensis]
MKIYLHIFSLLMLAFGSSCSDSFLENEPHELTDAVFWQTAAQAESALAGVYTPLQDEEALGGEEWCGMEAFSDIGYMNDNYSDFIAMSEFRALQNTENDLSLNSYRSYFQVIKRANDVLYNVPSIQMDETQKRRILGEANFLLSYAYFTMIQRYGGVPIYDPENSDAATVRGSAADVWAVIESSLTAATGQLSMQHEQGRPGLGAAWGLLAKAYAYQGKWSECRAAAEQVINDGFHTLHSSYAELFTIEHETASEHLWSLGARFGSYPITPILYLPNDVWGGDHDEQLGAGWRLVSATNAFYDSYQAGDIRRQATVAKRNVDVVTYNGTTDVLRAPNNQSDVVCIKFMQPYATRYENWNPGLDVPAVRLADVLLLHAEAIINLNGGGPTNRTVGVAEAATSFNKVRTRANLTPIDAPTFNDLMYERKMELAFEGGDRHFDLVRWGLAAEVYNNTPAEGSYKPARTFNPAMHNLLPYPQNEIDVSNGTILQNPGYQN